MSPLCQIGMTLAVGFAGSVWGDGTADERGRAITSRLSGERMLYSPNGFAGAARQALTKLGVEWEPTETERAYNEGRSTQVPVNPECRRQAPAF